MKITKFFLILILFCSFSAKLFAQDPLAGKDLSNIKVDVLTESQITQIKKKLEQSGLTIDQVESQAIAKGMPQAEFAKLKERVNGSVGLIMAQKKVNINSKSQVNNTSQSKNYPHILFPNVLKIQYFFLTQKPKSTIIIRSILFRKS
jgi:hypothetical protein